MSPEAWREGTLVVAVLIEVFFKEFLRENSSLQEAIHSFLNFDVDKSTGADLVDEVVQYYKIIREILEFHAPVLWA